jgi:hypothetical protein
MQTNSNDIPTINRKAENPLSTSPLASMLASVCSSQVGIIARDHKSFTKDINVDNARRLCIDYTISLKFRRTKKPYLKDMR